MKPNTNCVAAPAGRCRVAGRHTRVTAGLDSDLPVAAAATAVRIIPVVVIIVVAAIPVMIVTAIVNRP